MTVRLNKAEFRLYGTCNECGAALYDLSIEDGTALCSGCEAIEHFDPKQFANAEPAIEAA